MGNEQDLVEVELTKYGRAKTVTPHPTGLYFKMSVGRIDGEQEQETVSHTMEDLPLDLYNAILNIIGDDGVLFNDNLKEIAGLIDDY